MVCHTWCRRLFGHAVNLSCAYTSWRWSAAIVFRFDCRRSPALVARRARISTGPAGACPLLALLELHARCLHVSLCGAAHMGGIGKLKVRRRWRSPQRKLVKGLCPLRLWHIPRRVPVHGGVLGRVIYVGIDILVEGLIRVEGRMCLVEVEQWLTQDELAIGYP